MSPPLRVQVLAGAARGTLLSVLILPFLLIQNPWFLDAPLLWMCLVSLPLAVLGILGARLHRRANHPRLSAVVLLLSLVAIPALSAWPRPAPTGNVKLLVFGLDGATFDVIDGLGTQLPEIQALQQEGVRADLMSMEPMFSPLLWTTIATGKTPEEHGIHGFHVQYGDVKVPQFWEILARQGWKVGVYKWLISYPPMQVPGFMVPGWMAAGPETWPDDLRFVKEMELSRRLKRKKVAATRGPVALLADGILHGIRLGTAWEAARVTLTERLGKPEPLRSQKNGQLLKARIDRDVAVWSIHRWDPDLVTFTDYATDALSHKFWKVASPGPHDGVSQDDIDRWGSTLTEVYAQADGILGDLRDAVGPQARVVMVSDHGFSAFSSESDAGRFWEPLTEGLKTLLTEKIGPVEVTRLGHKVIVTLTSGDVDRDALETFLSTVVQASTGQPFYRWDPVEGDPRSLGLTLRDENVTADRIASDRVGDAPLGRFVSLTEPDSGVHAARGVFLAAGPGIATGARLTPLTVLDAAPIFLALAGQPAGADMTGKVPQGLFVSDPQLSDAPVSWDAIALERRLLQGEDGVDEAALKALGYIE